MAGRSRFLSSFRWITALGSSPAVVAAVIIATGFLWSQRRFLFHHFSLGDVSRCTCYYNDRKVDHWTAPSGLCDRYERCFFVVPERTCDGGHGRIWIHCLRHCARINRCSRTLRGHLLDYGSHFSNWLQPHLFGCPLRNGCSRRVPRWWVLATGWFHHCRMEYIILSYTFRGEQRFLSIILPGRWHPMTVRTVLPCALNS